MDFKQLCSFVAVVKYGSFTLAAEKLYLSQPTISTHIRQLEEELHTQLVIRTTKNMEITKKGLEIYEYASQIMRLKGRVEECCNSDASSQIQIGASTIPSCYVLPGLLSDFLISKPELRFNIHQTDSQGVVDGLMQNIFDIGFIGMNTTGLDLVTIPFCEDRMVLITPVSDHFLSLKAQDTEVLPDFSKEHFITREEGSGSLKAADHFLDLFGIAPDELHVVAKVNDCETIKNLTAAGLGISIISERAAQNFIESGRVLKFDLPKEHSTRNLYISYRKNYILPPELEAFLQFLKTREELGLHYAENP